MKKPLEYRNKRYTLVMVDPETGHGMYEVSPCETDPVTDDLVDALRAGKGQPPMSEVLDQLGAVEQP